MLTKGVRYIHRLEVATAEPGRTPFKPLSLKRTVRQGVVIKCLVDRVVLGGGTASSARRHQRGASIGYTCVPSLPGSDVGLRRETITGDHS